MPIPPTVVPSDFWCSPVLRWNDTTVLGPGGVGAGDVYCPGFVGPTYANNQNDKALIAGMPTPGLCVVSSNKGRAVDKKKSAGSDGSRLTFHGIDNAEGQMQLTIWTPAQLVALNTLVGVLFPPSQKSVTNVTKRPGGGSTTTVINSTHVAFATQTIPQAAASTTITKSTVLAKPQPFSVTHPDWARIKVNSVIFMGIEGMTPGKVQGARVFTFKWIEFLQPGKNNVTQSAIGAQAKGSALDPSSNPSPGFNPAANGPNS